MTFFSTPYTPTLVVTRHQGLVDWLRAVGMIPDGVRVVAHVTPDDVLGQHVIGVLPIALAACAASVTEVPLRLPPEMRGKELSAEQVEEYRDGPPVTYVVCRAGDPRLAL